MTKDLSILEAVTIYQTKCGEMVADSVYTARTF